MGLKGSAAKGMTLQTQATCSNDMESVTVAPLMQGVQSLQSWPTVPVVVRFLHEAAQQQASSSVPGPQQLGSPVGIWPARVITTRYSTVKRFWN